MAKFKIATPDQIVNVIEGGAIPRVNFFSPVDSSDYLEGQNQAEKQGGKVITSKQLGTPIFDRLVLLSEGTGLNNDLIINEVILTVSQAKNIIKTPMQGRNGTVKEYISLGDYNVNVRGFLIDENPHRMPEEKTELLREFCELNEQIKVASKFLGLFGISSVVVDNYNISQEVGTRRVPFAISLLSDEDIELQITEEQNANT